MDEMEAESCSLMLKDPVSGDLTVRAARSKSEKKSVYYPNHNGNGKRFKYGEGVAGWVLKEQEAAMLNDVSQESRFVHVPGLTNNVNSLICFPILGVLRSMPTLSVTIELYRRSLSITTLI
jgi:GAF domain-containing protein